MSDKHEVTELLNDWASGDEAAREKLIPLVYADLRGLAAGLMRRERGGHTLQPTALVHEALFKLYNQRKISTRGKKGLIGLMAELMRRVLVDHARAKAAQRRGGGRTVLTFAEELGDGATNQVDLLDLDLALQRLTELDPRQAKVIELRVFGGLEVKEVAEVLEISPATVKREWATGRVWLYRELKG